MSDIAQSIAIPHEHRPTRLPSFPNLERTAVVPTVATGTVAVTSGYMRDWTLVRSPTYPLWTRSTPSTQSASLYYWATPTSGAFGSIAAVGNSVIFPYEPYTTYGANGTDAAWIASMKRRYPLARTRDGRAFVVAGAGTAYSGVTISFSATINATFNLVFELWDGTGETTVVSATATVNASYVDYVSPTLLSGGFFRLVSATCTSWTSGNVNVTALYAGITSGTSISNPSGTSCACYAPVFAPPEFVGSRIPYNATRANAAGVLLTNVTAVLDKEGTISAARVPRSAAPGCFNGSLDLAASSFTTLISNVYPKDRYFGPMEKGLYAYTLPDSSTDSFFDCVSDSLHADTFPMPVFNLDSFEYVSLITMADLGGNGSTIAVTQDVHLEFRSSSMLFPVGFSMTSLEAYHTAQMALAQQGVFFENPVHLAAIGSLIRAAVTRLAPVVLPYAKTAAVAVGNRILNSAVNTLNTKMGQITLGGVAASTPPKRKVAASRKKKTLVKRKK